MFMSENFRMFAPRRLSDVATADRSKYLNAKINAAIGLCPEPRHPLDNERKPPMQQASWGKRVIAGPKRKY
jgi:hypothetical protein